MNRFNPHRDSTLDHISFDRNPFQQQSHSRTPESPPSVLDSAGYGNSPNETWSDSSSSSSEAMMPYHQPWVVEPAMKYSLISPQSPIEPPPDGLPRIVPSMGGGGSPEWSTSLLISNYSPSRQLKPEMRRLPAGRPPSDWVHAPGSIRASHHPVGARPPHSHSSSSSTNPTPTTGLSPTSASMPYHSLPLSLVSPPIKLEMDREDVSMTHMDDGEDTNADPPYSQLIYEALLTAPGKKLPLQGIYLWFEKNTAKGRDRSSKGWQNSIRHNLSMNAGFEAVREESTPGKKAVNYWRLTDEAVNNGIQSTTRYRKQTNYKKPVASDPPAPQRQRSGAKGGKATKTTARFRSNGSMSSMSQDEYRRERACRQQQQQQQHLHLHHQHQHQHQRQQQVISSQRQLPKNFLYNSQYLHHRSSPTTTSAAGTTVLSPVYARGGATPTTTTPNPMTLTVTRSSAIESFDLSNVVGCADAPPCTAPTPIFCNMAGPGPDCLVFDSGFMGWDGLHSPFAAAEISTSDLHIGL
ncbi:hypothetical protein BDW59DRAFT_122127 [Aspergillus cavernicola]|uniref:Fork-head domain-containing protein n=1 Tax=Aspergillus cavernicola TaxID=176166 RepID=A0ABR4HV48_9EURO